MAAAAGNPEVEGAMPEPPQAAGEPESGTAAAPLASGAERRRLPRPSSRRVGDRLTVYVVRALFFLVAAGLGLHGAKTVGDIAGTDVSVFAGMVVACTGAVVLIVLEAFFARTPIRTIASIFFGLLMGLIFALVFRFVVEIIVQAVAPQQLPQLKLTNLLSFLNLLATCIFCYFGVALLLETKDDFKFIIPFVEFRKETKSPIPLILDTSVFVDGRLEAMLATGVLDQRLAVPRFVLEELHLIADSPDRSLRERGRRGLDILRSIQRQHLIDEVEFHRLPGEPVDAALLRLVTAEEGKLLTTDHNLTKRAQVQGVPVLNINDLATAMKPVIVPGETLNVRLLRAGEDAGQAVGFLRDGTMVVVEGAQEHIGREVSVEVTSALQTTAGKMAFGKLRRPPRVRTKK
jgi:uncharacterized protein YacL